MPRTRWAGFVVLPLLVLAGCGGDESTETGRASTSPGLVIGDEGVAHIHGVGVDPADDALIIATHSGLFRAASGQRRAERVTDRRQDTMGFTVVGPGRFLGSGHPDVRDGLPSSLGLIRSDDAGRSWKPVSLLGKADFHVLRALGRRVYAADALSGSLLVSSDEGRTWRTSSPPSPPVDLAIDPAEPDHAVVSGERGLARTRDGGRTWKRLPARITGLMAWSTKLVLIDAGGAVHASPDAGATFDEVGQIDGQPTALAAAGRELLVALTDNTVRSSTDTGRRWQLRLATE